MFTELLSRSGKQDFWMSNRISSLEEEIASGHPTVLLTSGDSMEPLLYHRDTRVVVINRKNLGKNDLPVYKRPTGQLVLHRIIKVDEKFFYTRGDNRCGLEAVPKEWVIGMVTEIYRKNRHFSVTNRRYKLYVHGWNIIYPLRWFWYKLRARIK